MYLVDTNVWLECLLNQQNAQEVSEFLERVPSSEILMSDFSFHSIGVIMIKLEKTNVLSSFVQDVFLDGDVELIHLQPADTDGIVQATELYHLDFDDAYQYETSEKYGLDLVSFDADFDRTPRGRKTPAQALKML